MLFLSELSIISVLSDKCPENQILWPYTISTFKILWNVAPQVATSFLHSHRKIRIPVSPHPYRQTLAADGLVSWSGYGVSKKGCLVTLDLLRNYCPVTVPGTGETPVSPFHEGFSAPYWPSSLHIVTKCVGCFHFKHQQLRYAKVVIFHFLVKCTVTDVSCHLKDLHGMLQHIWYMHMQTKHMMSIHKVTWCYLVAHTQYKCLVKSNTWEDFV